MYAKEIDVRGEEQMTEISWSDYEAAITPNKIISKIDINKPLQENLVRIFYRLLKTFWFLLNKEQGLHCFSNSSFTKAHYLFPTSSSFCHGEYLKSIDIELLKWLKEHTFAKPTGIEGKPRIVCLNDLRSKRIIRDVFVEKVSESEIDELLLLPFNFSDWNFGYFILWGTRNHNKSEDVDKTKLKGWLYSWYSCLVPVIQRLFKVSKDIYLPEYFTSGWKKVAILFADIRNFTPLTEILRSRAREEERSGISREKSGTLQKIVTEFYREMSRIIHENGTGRIDKFLGDGIMAIFGEQKSKSGEPACDAIYVAAKMIKRFNELKTKWQEEAFGPNFEREYNESVEIGLGIGIDYGSVYFELLGDDNHREYSAVGDHVNFASRLQGYAAKDIEQEGKYPPIIISRTAHCCCKEWLKDKKHIRLTFKGKPYTYDCYGIYPDYLIADSFFDKEKPQPPNPHSPLVTKGRSSTEASS